MSVLMLHTLIPYHIPVAHVFAVLSSTRVSTTFYPAVGGRNLGAGLAVLAFSCLREHRALGVLLLCLMCDGFVDTWIVLREERLRRPVAWIRLHVMNTGVMAVFGGDLVGVAVKVHE